MQVKRISRSRDGRRAQIVVLSNNQNGKTVSTTKHVVREGNTNEFVWKTKVDGQEVKEIYTLS